ncbi:MAG: hypothetical protein ABIG66_02495 [Candidatus Kerfeldbacteria bacterium]
MATTSIEFRPKKQAQEARERTEPGFTISYATKASPDHPTRNEDTGQLIKAPEGEGFVIGIYDGASKGGPEGSGVKASRAAAAAAQENAAKLFGDPDKRGKYLRNVTADMNEAVKRNGEGGKTTMNVTLFEKLSENEGRVTSASIGDSPGFVINIEERTIEQFTVNDDPQQEVDAALTAAGVEVPGGRLKKDTVLTPGILQALAAAGVEAVELRLKHVMASKECTREEALKELEGNRGNVFLSVLPKSLGIEGKLEPHVTSRKIDLRKDIVLGCSDGIRDVLPDDYIVRTVIAALEAGDNPSQALINEVRKVRGAKPDDRLAIAVIPDQIKRRFEEAERTAVA